MAVLLSGMALGGCQYQIALGVEQMTQTIPVISGDNLIDNLVHTYKDPDYNPAQVTLKNSVSTAANGISYGANPDIALRAIALTGINLGVTNSLSYNWSIDPINGTADLQRIQKVLNFALGREKEKEKPEFESFSALKVALANTGYTKPGKDNPKVDSDSELLLQIMSKYPPLPDSKFVEINGGDCSGDDKLDGDGLNHLDKVCFKAKQDASGGFAKGESLKSRLVLWVALMPELSQAIKQPGASNGGASPLSVSANQSMMGGSR